MIKKEYSKTLSDGENNVSIQAVASSTCDHSEERGASMIEYALLAALIAVVCIVGVVFLGEQTSTTFSQAGQGFCPATGC